MIRMGKKFLAGLLLVAMLMTFAVTAYAANATVKVEELILRAKPTTQSSSLAAIPYGTTLTILGKEGNWYKVKYGSKTGYVYGVHVIVDGDVDDSIKVDDDTLKVGSKGEAVKKMQQRLKELGYFDASCTGTFGKQTEEAVKWFQENNKLKVDGMAGVSTLEKLYSASAKKANGEKAGTTGSGSASATDGTMRKGDRSDEVKKVQKRLKELGFFTSSTTGYFGDATEKAVEAFQKMNGLKVTGEVDSKTHSKLYSSSAKDVNGKKVGSTESSTGTTTSTSLKKGMSGSEVKAVQTRLKELGYFKSNVTGYYGDVTVSAVKAFQKRNGLSVTGVVDSATQKKLNSSSAKAAEGYVAPEEDKDAIAYGNNNDAIKAVQRRLKELGYFKNSVTGYFGDATTAAVKAFQSRNGLSATGKVNTATLNKLNSSSAKPAEGYEAEDDDTLSYGDQSSEVKKMQQRLKELGYFDNTCTGYFGGATQTALKKFQSRNGLSTTGKADKKTLDKLYSSSAKAAEGYSSGSSSSSTDTTMKYGDRSDAVRAMQTRLKELGYMTEAATGYFGSSTRSAVEAFQTRNGLSVTGVADAATMKKMLSSSAVSAAEKTYKTERLDWFNGGSSRIPNRATFKVKDVRTGLVFTAKRQGGTNHMDAEPLTSADTAILLRINGGSFTWKRRPMLVMYNGRVYAASIYSEPHGADTIGGNGFDGQFCLHFYGSKTHGTDRVDEGHAQCEREAMKATW